MAEEAGEEPKTTKEITFNIKSSSDAKFNVTVPESMTVLDLKKKLSTAEYANIEAGRQRLIYSGRVLKDTDELAVYKIKDGNTVHMVRGAASNQNQNAPSQGSSSSSVPPGAGVPTNIQTGTGTDPLAGLTGARYAGFAQMPGAEQFGPDGGMGPPQAPDDMLRMLENPMFQGQMNEAMNNPHVIQMMQNSPMVRNNPWLRQMLENPEMRRMMMDPQMIRQSMQMSRMMGGMGGQGQGQNSMPAPGVTDTTRRSGQDGGATGGGTSATPQQTDTTGGPSIGSPPPQNPFAMFGQPGAGGAAGAQGNPFAALFGGGAGGAGGAGAMPNMFGNPASPPSTNPTPASATQTQGQGTAQSQQQQQQPNPFAGLFGTGAGAGGDQQQNPMAQMAQQMMQNPEMMRMAMQNLGLGAGAGQGGAQGGFNPFLGAGGFGSPAPQPPTQAPDTRPPEEQYAEQLRQLNDMGFYEFERNVRALRMAGGNVQGAVEFLLGGA